MGSQNSKNQNHSSTENKEEADDKNDDGGVSGAVLAGVAVAAVGATALAVWGLSKHIGSSEPEENNMLMGSTSAAGSLKLEDIDDDDDKWTKPKYGWFKLNTDASEASAGGLIRDHTGKWIVGFTARFEPCHSIKAELQALREGMKLACDRGLKKVIIETDCEQAVNLIKNPKWNSENHSYGCIIEECRSFMMKFGDWNNIIELNHIYRKNNECADAMAKMAKKQTEPLKIWEQAPTNLRIQYRLSVDMI